MTKRLLEFPHQAEHIAQLALHREWAFGALFASGDGHVVEAFASLRKKESVGVFQGQITRECGIWNDVAIAQLRQNHFERLAESVENANRVLQRNDGGVRGIGPPFCNCEGESRL